MNPSELAIEVAVALGYTWMRPAKRDDIRVLAPPADHDAREWLVLATGKETIAVDAYRWVPKFDIDWSVTGPLIERFGFTVWKVEDLHGLGSGPEWRATHETCCDPGLGAESGATPLEAVCKLIVLLHEAGRIKDGVLV